MTKKNAILLTGASGYIGGRLLPRLLAKGYPVRCLARNPGFLQSKVPSVVEVVKGDVLDTDSLKLAFNGIETAYYFIHSMGDKGNFEEKDRLAAVHFGKAAKGAGVGKIIYLGGLSCSPASSSHMRSRVEVGRILRESGVPTLEFRASIIVGSGSLSFEMLRSLADKLPVMIMPKWVSVLAQPIGVEDILKYLEKSLAFPLPQSRIIEIGGADQLTYRDLIAEYARQKNLKRLLIPIPVLTPWLSSLWLGLVTPVYARIGRKLIDSIRYPSIVSNPQALTLFDIKPIGAAAAIHQALKEQVRSEGRSKWFDAVSSGVSAPAAVPFQEEKKKLTDCRTITLSCSREQAFKPIAEIGGENGWYAYDILWRLRGFIDLLIGGVGMRRGRPNGRSLRAGDALDFWRVEMIRQSESLKLAAEMKLPGSARLEFTLSGSGKSTTIKQCAVFYPDGLMGTAYWYLLTIPHILIFNGMLKRIGRKALTADKT